MSATTLTGENDYARSSELSKRLDAFIKAEGELAVERLDAEEADFVRISEALTSLPFLANKKMVVLYSPSKSKDFADRGEELLKALPDTTDLILYEPKFDKRSSVYKLLKSKTDFKEFKALDLPELARWASEQAKASGSQLSTADARYLVERIGLNQQIVASEVEKLSLLGGTIDRTRIDTMTEPTPQSTIFQLIDAAMNGRVEHAMKLYDEQRSMKVEPQQIVAMFAWQLHAMAVVKAAGDRSPDRVVKEAGLSPYVASKTASLVRRLTLGRLVQLVDELVQIDIRSKREALDLDAALKNFIIKLA
jgi:DNA polymerase III delta subunit